jgi:putative heme-binding domain-containing protein
MRCCGLGRLSLAELEIPPLFFCSLRITMKWTLPLAIVWSVSFCLAPIAANAEGESRPLFNGKDLSGWEGNPDSWSVQNGEIVGVTKADAPLPYNQFLIWRGGTVKNFELTVTAKQQGNNSGIQYRSRELKDVGPWSIGGYQCDIHPQPANNAMLYDERGRAILANNGQTVIVDDKGQRWLTAEKAPLKVEAADWNEYTIIAQGNRLIHKINGQVVVDVTDQQTSERELEGLLAIQIHRGPAMEVRIKQITLKHLPDTPAASQQQVAIPADAKQLERPAPRRRQQPQPPKANKTSDAAPGKNAPAATAVARQADARQPAANRPARPRRPDRPATGLAIGQNKATPIGNIKVMKDFQVELLYSVPNVDQGSWVNLCTDNKNRIIASDQYGGLYRFAPPPAGQPLDPAKIVKVPVDIRAVNGMIWAFDALYVGVNDYEKKIDSGLYRISDSDGDDELDRVELLRAMEARGDHGVHALLLAPDKQSLLLVTGNGTTPTEFSSSRVPTVWGEDHLLPRMPDGRGFMREVLGPGGIIYKVSPDGKQFEVYSSGYRNIFDASLNRQGELFTYDADMEYDFNTSWYRPTRVNHVTSGSEYGWRNGAGKWPEFYPDNLPATLNIGPGSPTGTTFGYGAKFPARYQNALYILDWSWGKVYAVHLVPDGASYKATKEDFIVGAPLPVTDAIVHPVDGAMYFAIGGRKVQSGLYRVTYTGPESTAPAMAAAPLTELAQLRRKLESHHRPNDSQAIEAAWPHLDHADRFVRFAARTAIEHQPHAHWADRALSETNAGRRLTALLALARVGCVDPQHRKPSDPQVDRQLQQRIIVALASLDWNKLSHDERITLVRTYEICFNRFGMPDVPDQQRVLAQLDAQLPAASPELNWLLCETLVYLQSPTVAEKGVALIQQVPTQEEQIEYARSLRMLKNGWTPQTRTAYFEWLLKAANYRGGASFEQFINFIRTDAIATLSEAEKESMQELLARQPVRKSPLEGLAEAFAGRKQTAWTLDELASAAETSLEQRNYENGRKVFAATACFACHRFDNQGGMTGPDLTRAGARYTVRDLLDQIIHPSKEINEQFAPVVITTDGGLIHTGVIVNLNGDTVTVNTDLTDPNQRVQIDRKQVESLELSKVSPMPEKLLNYLTRDEILDLVAYILSAGDRNHRVFQSAEAVGGEQGR